MDDNIDFSAATAPYIEPAVKGIADSGVENCALSHKSPAPTAEQADPRLESFLAASGITAEEDCPLWRVVEAADLNLLLGRQGEARVSGAAVEIPYLDMNGTAIHDNGIEFRRYRLLNPVEGGPKYLARAGSGNHLFVPRRFAGAYEQGPLGKILLITEGEKKAAAACHHGIPAVGIAGVQQWADTTAREAEKSAAEEAGEQVPRLTAETPVMPELMALIERIEPAKILVLFDADGRPVERRAIKVGGEDDPRFTSGSGGEVRTPGGKRFVLNRNVFAAGHKFAAALRLQNPGLPVAIDFVQHHVEIDGRRTSLQRQGLDDYLMAETDRDAARQMVVDMLGRATAVSVDQAEVVKRRREEASRSGEVAGGQGYIALGFSGGAEGAIYHVWSRATGSVRDLSEAALLRSTTILSSCGVEFATRRWGNVITKKDAGGNETEEVVGIKSFAAQSEIVSACAAAGPWSPDGHTRGTGAWYDSADALIVNCRDGVFRISGDEVTQVDRCETGRRDIYPMTSRGKFSETAATIDDIRHLVRQVENGWKWRRESDGALAVGWILLQPYVAALDARPHLYLIGESGSGKSYFQQWVESLLGSWSIRVENGKESSLAGMRQAVKTDAVTLLVDELEPKQGGTPEESYRLNTLIRGVVQMLRAAYSQSRSGSYSVVKGTSHGEVQRQDVRVSAMLAGIADSELEQADRNRMLRLEMHKLPRDPATGELIGKRPTLPDGEIGAMVFRRLWARWPRFTTMRDVIASKIPHPEERMRLTLASPLAAYLLALDEPVDGVLAEAMIADVAADYCGPGAADNARPDQEVALERLLALQLDVGGIRKPISDAVVAALGSGLGGPGRGAGGPDAAALRLHGMTARQDGSGLVRLFVAEKHPELERLVRSLGQSGIVTLLGRIDGARPARQANGIDGRVRLGAGAPWRGVWVPTAITRDEEDGEGAVAPF